MRLLAPLGLAAAAAAIPLVLWYLLRPRRRRVAVGSTFLWRAIDRPATAATPWQRFRGDATFWLALLAVLAVAAALARPAVPVPVALGDHTILVIDASGSMLADERGVTRAELARRAATELTSALAPGQEVSVIAAGPRATIELASSSDIRAIGRALAGIASSHAPSDLADAFTLATSLQRPGQRTITHLLTDRDVPADALAVAPPGLAITGIGSDRPNVAISRLTAAPLGGGDHQVLAQVRSYAATPVRGTLHLAVDDVVVVEQPVRLAPRATEDVLLTVPTGAVSDTTAVLTARIGLQPDLTEEVPDALPFDDTATALLAQPRELRVVVAGPGNRFLELAFEAMPDVEVTAVPKVPDDLDGVDLLVVDRVGAPAVPPVATLLIAPTTWPDGLAPVGRVELPALTSQASDHPLLADVDLTGLAVAEVERLDAPAMTPLASAPDTALLLAGRMGGSPVVVLPFELQASDLPLRPAWPLFVANVTSWAVGGTTTGVAVPAGSVVLPDVGDATHVLAHPPDGTEPRRLPTTGPTPPGLLVDQVGTWRLELRGGGPAGDGGDPVGGSGAAGSGSAGGSGAAGSADDGPRELLVPVIAAPGEGDLSAPRPASTSTPIASATADGTTGLRELAWPFALLALVLLVGEWLWSQWLAPRWRGRDRGGRAQDGWAGRDGRAGREGRAGRWAGRWAGRRPRAGPDGRDRRAGRRDRAGVP